MEKAYDVAVLAAKLKGRGLDVAEEAAKIVIEETLKWVEESAALSATPYDNMALILLPQLKSTMLAVADRIDGVAG